MNENKIIVNLPNGDSLVAEVCAGSIGVGIMRDDDWIQDLVVVEASHKDGKYIEDKFDIYVYGNENEEEYTECFGVDRVHSNTI